MPPKKLSIEFFKKHGRKGGKQGGAKGGKAAAEKLTPKERQERARKAAAARWGKKKGPA